MAMIELHQHVTSAPHTLCDGYSVTEDKARKLAINTTQNRYDLGLELDGSEPSTGLEEGTIKQRVSVTFLTSERDDGRPQTRLVCPKLVTREVIIPDDAEDYQPGSTVLRHECRAGRRIGPHQVTRTCQFVGL